jgi:DNA-binding HxlR family transcriptional regulator
MNKVVILEIPLINLLFRLSDRHRSVYLLLAAKIAQNPLEAVVAADIGRQANLGSEQVSTTLRQLVHLGFLRRTIYPQRRSTYALLHDYDAIAAAITAWLKPRGQR